MLSFENDAALWELGTATGPYSRYQMKRYIAESQNDLYADGQLRLMIVCEGKEVAGIVDVFSFDARHNRAEVGIVVRFSFGIALLLFAGAPAIVCLCAGGECSQPEAVHFGRLYRMWYPEGLDTGRHFLSGCVFFSENQRNIDCRKTFKTGLKKRLCVLT